MGNTRKGFKLTPTDKDKRIEELEKENAELESVFKICEKNADTYYDQLTKANLLLKDVYKIAMEDWNDPKWHDQVLQKAREYLKEKEK